MIYAVRQRGSRQTLVEMTSTEWTKAARREPDLKFSRVNRATAEQWVRDGKEHETGLYIDDGKVRYAFPDSTIRDD